jgi:hypothetical protein
MVSDWLVRACMSRWLHEAQLHRHGDALAGLAPLRQRSDLTTAATWVHAARRAVRVQHQTVRGIVRELRDWSTEPRIQREDPLSPALAASVEPLVQAGVNAGVAVSDGWQSVTETIVEAARSIGWWAVAQAATSGSCPKPGTVAAHALAQPAADLQASADRLTDRLLAVTEPSATQHGRPE